MTPSVTLPEGEVRDGGDLAKHLLLAHGAPDRAEPSLSSDKQPGVSVQVQGEKFTLQETFTKCGTV